MTVAVGSVGYRAPASHGLWRPGGIVVPPPPQPQFAQVAADNFNRANGTLAGSNGWLATSDGSAAIVSSQASGVGASIAADYRTETYSPDQFSQATVGSVLNSGDFVGLTLRHSSSTNADYAALYFNNAGSPQAAIYVRTAPGSYTAMTTVTIAAQTVGTVLLFYAIGSVLVFQVGGVSMCSVTDSSVTGGAPGITTYGTSTLDNWVGGNANMGAALGAQIGSDNFNRTNGNVSTGQPNWTPITATFSGVPCLDGVIVSNEVNVSDGDHHADYRNETYNPDQWSQIGMGSIPAVVASSAPFIGVIVRWNGTNGYLCCFFAAVNAPGVGYRIYLIVAGGTSTLLTSVATNGSSGSASPSNPTGTVYTAVAKGTRISMRCNGTEVAWVNDSTCTAGQPAYQVYPQATGTTADNYAAGNV